MRNLRTGFLLGSILVIFFLRHILLTADLRKYLDSKIPYNLQSYGPKNLGPRLHNDSSNIAWLFLTVQNLQHKEIWRCWFGEEHLLMESIWMSYKSKCDPFCGEDAKRCKCLRTKAGWGKLDVAAEVLLRESLKDPGLEYFIFISDTAIPVKNFEAVQNEIHKGNDSEVCFTGDIKAMEGSVMLKHHQWMILNRQHAEKLQVKLGASILKENTLTFDPYQGASDEFFINYVLPSLPSNFFKAGETQKFFDWIHQYRVQHKCRTFVRWIESDPLPEPFPKIDINTPGLRITNDQPFKFQKIPAAYLQSIIDHQDFYFARKFEKDCEVTSQNTSSSVSLVDFLSQHVPGFTCNRD